MTFCILFAKILNVVCGCSSMVRIPAFQAGCVGSIPIICSTKKPVELVFRGLFSFCLFTLLFTFYRISIFRPRPPKSPQAQFSAAFLFYGHIFYNTFITRLDRTVQQPPAQAAPGLIVCCPLFSSGCAYAPG